MTSITPGKAPYLTDDTRRWTDAYRINNLIKPSLVFRAATDANFINDLYIPLPAYGNQPRYTRSICNVVSPGQRLAGVLSWEATESLDNITQTAQVTALDVLPQSKISTTISGFGIGTKGGAISSIGSMPARWYSDTIRYQWVQDGNGIAQKLTGNKRIEDTLDPALAQNIGYDQHFREARLLYRQFEPEVIKGDFSQFPDPAVALTESEGNNEWWDIDSQAGTLKGVGAYYVLVDQEVMRITRIQRNTRPTLDYLFVVPGGRGAAGYITNHSVGATVTLLGFPPYNGLWAAFGYLMPTDYKINHSPFRPGTCWVSYEGYGNPGQYTTGGFKPKLSKQFDRNNNMCFTGYWFTQSPQTTLDNTGVPQFTCTFQSSGYVLSEQKIEPSNIQRSKNIFYSWARATFDQIGYTRKVPGDWYDYNKWDPSLPGAYPLTISTEYAQHKAFFDHMNDTDMGRQCEWCRQEWLDYIAQHTRGKPTGSIAEARAVGKHIYKESIRVFNNHGQFHPGPVVTFGRLMHALAIAAWDNPLEGNELGTRWSKFPNQLFDNLNAWTNGRVWNGQLAYQEDNGGTGYDYSNQTHEDKYVHGQRLPLKSPFTTQYDRQPWSQPMQDVADLNHMTYTITREGFPAFAPTGKKLRGLPNPNLPYSRTPRGKFIDPKHSSEVSDSDVGRGEWHLSYGGSIDNYTHAIDPSSVITLAYVSCQTAFGDEVTFTIPAAGTGIQVSNDRQENTTEKLIWYSSKVGNKEGLQLSSGAQQTDAVALDNVLLGLEWNTNPASWGLTLKRGPDQLTQVDAQPPTPNPQGLKLYFESKDSKKHKAKPIVVKIKKFVNFMMQRRYIGPAVFDDKGTIVYPLQLNETPEFGKGLRSGVTNVQRFLATQSNIPFVKFGNSYQYSIQNGSLPWFWDNPGQWGQATYHAAKDWLKANAEYIKTDVWWYVQNGLPWEQYVGAITGMPIPQRRDNQDNSKWLIDQEALKIEADTWMKRFFKDAINYGNAVVDDSINKATQKTLNTNIADPRIQLGDVIWPTVPGYLGSKNAFGSQVAPFLHGIYVIGITRTIDLKEGTFTGSYQGYRYRGNFESNVTENSNNYYSYP